VKQLLYILISVFLFISCSEVDKKAPLPDKNDLAFSAEAQLYTINEAMAKDPDNPEYYFKRARFYYEFYALGEALTDVDKAIELDDDHGKSYLLKGLILLGMNKPQEALIAAKKAEELNVTDPDLYSLLSKCYLLQKQLALSEQYLNKLKEISPNYSDVYLIQAMNSMAKGDTSGAKGYLKTALERNNRNREASLLLIPIFYKRKSYDSCLAMVISSRQYYPNDIEFMVYQGLILEALQQNASAVSVWNMILQKNPDHLVVNEELARMAYLNNNYVEADRRYRKLVQLNPSNPLYLLRLAELKEKQEKPVEALDYYKKLLAKDSTSTSARTGIARIYWFHPELKSAPKPIVVP
jgi:tetratricopeptide (TPR) repeat protein